VKLLIALLAAAAALAAQSTLNVTGPASTTAGETVDTQNVIAGDVAAVELRFPSGTIVTLGPGALSAGKQIRCTDQPTGRFCMIFGVNANLIAGDAADAVFPGQAVGSSTLQPTDVLAATPTGQKELVTVTALIVDILSPCDLDSDGAVGDADVDVLVHQGLGDAACTADMNSDGICNIVDVQRLVRVVMGLDACPI
jgi:hypothetical protein